MSKHIKEITEAYNKGKEEGRGTLRNELLQRLNDYECPISMSAEDVREIISNKLK